MSGLLVYRRLIERVRSRNFTLRRAWTTERHGARPVREGLARRRRISGSERRR